MCRVKAMCLLQLILKVHISRIFLPFSNLDSNAIHTYIHIRTYAIVTGEWKRWSEEANERATDSQMVVKIKSRNGLSNRNIEYVLLTRSLLCGCDVILI